MVYTLTQFSTVKSVVFQIDGQTVTVFGGEGIVLDGPVGRADYYDQLPAIFVDRPAYGAALGNPGTCHGQRERVRGDNSGSAVLDASGKTLVDQPVMATCGTGCRGTFDVTLAYTVAKAQWGTLRVYDPSEQGRDAGGHPRLPGLARSCELRRLDQYPGLPPLDGEAAAPAGDATCHLPPAPWPHVSPAFVSAA